MGKCPKCGNKLNNIDVLCPRCGTLVEVINVNQNAPITSSSGTMDGDSDKDESAKPQAQDYYQNLTVYSDDLPVDPAAPDDEPDLSDIDVDAAAQSGGPQADEDAPFSRISSDLSALSAAAAARNELSPLQKLQQEALGFSPQQQEEKPAPSSDPTDHLPESFTVIDQPVAPEHPAAGKPAPQAAPKPVEVDLIDEAAVPPIIAASVLPLEPAEGTPASGSQAPAKSAAPEAPEERPRIDTPVDESTYSENYLNAIRNSNLPELDDLSDFDVDAFMDEYRQKKQRGEIDEAQPPVQANTPPQPEEPEAEDMAVPGAPASLYQPDTTPADADDGADYSQDEIAGDFQPDDHADALHTEETTTLSWGDPAEPQASEYAEDSRKEEAPVLGTGAELPFAEPEPAPTDEPADKTAAAAPASQSSVEIPSSSEEVVRAHKATKREPAAVITETDEPAKRKRRRMPVAVAILLWLVVAAAVFAGFYFLDGYVISAYGGYTELFDEITGGVINLDVRDHSVSVTSRPVQTDDGADAYRFEVSASADAPEVRIPLLSRSFALQDGKASIVITDYELAKVQDVTADQSPYTSSDIAFITAVEGADYSFSVVGLPLRLEPAAYERRLPLSAGSDTMEPFFDIDISVLPGANVTINGKDYTADVSSTGQLLAEIRLEAIGRNDFDVAVSMPGMVTATDRFTVVRDQSPAALEPSAGYIRSSEETFTFMGSADANANIAVQIGDDTFSGRSNAVGQYAIEASLTEYGLYTAELTASLAGHSDNTASVRVERVPEAAIFSGDAQDLSIAEAVGKSAALVDTPIRITGKIKNLETYDGTQWFTLYDGASELRSFYYGPSTINEEAAYTFYGMMDAEENAFYAMYAT